MLVYGPTFGFSLAAEGKLLKRVTPTISSDSPRAKRVSVMSGVRDRIRLGGYEMVTTLPRVSVNVLISAWAISSLEKKNKRTKRHQRTNVLDFIF